MKLHPLILLFLLSSCCNLPFRLPLLDCKGNLPELQINPNIIQIDSVNNIKLNIRGWLNSSKNYSFVEFSFNFNIDSTKLLIDETKIKLENNFNEKVVDTRFIKLKSENGIKTEKIFIQMQNLKKSNYIRINLDSIPIITGLDTVYKSFKIEVSKLK